MEVEEIVKYYEYFYQKLSGNYSYNYFLTKRDRLIINNFLFIFENNGIKKESLGPNFWYSYFCFQFEYWRTKYTFLGKNKVILSWIIGVEAYKRWNSKSKDWKWFSDNNLIRLFGINKQDLIPIVVQKQDINKLNINQEILKKNFAETNKLGMCFFYTNLYNDKSEICLNCKEQVDCKKLKTSYYV